MTAPRHHREDNLKTSETDNLKCSNIAKRLNRIEDVLNHLQTEFALHAVWHVIEQSALINAPKTKTSS